MLALFLGIQEPKASGQAVPLLPEEGVNLCGLISV